MKELLERGIKGVPVVTWRGQYALGLDLQQVDRLLDLSPERPARQLSGNELLARAVEILAAAIRYAYQLPEARYDDPFPGMEGAKPPFVQEGHTLVLADGTPYVPHGTYLGLVRHILAHGAKCQLEIERPDDPVFSHFGLYSQYGEPALAMNVRQLSEMAAGISKRLGAWPQEYGDSAFERVLQTFLGPQTLRQMLQRETYSLAQHTRQLMALLRKVGIEPERPLGDREFESLQLPEGVWA